MNIEVKTQQPQPPVFIDVEEQSRTYTFPNHQQITIVGIKSINVSKSGTHRLNTIDGKKHIVPSGWLHIAFDAPKWTF